MISRRIGTWELESLSEMKGFFIKGFRITFHNYGEMNTVEELVQLVRVPISRDQSEGLPKNRDLV